MSEEFIQDNIEETVEETGEENQQDSVEETNNQKEEKPKKKSAWPIISIILIIILVIVLVLSIIGSVFICGGGVAFGSLFTSIGNGDADQSTGSISSSSSEVDAEPEEKPNEEESSEASSEETNLITEYDRATNDAIVDVYASTWLIEHDYNNLSHDAWRVVDGFKDTAWVEGASDYGYGQKLSLELDKEYAVSGIKICAGYHIGEKLYYKNSRPAKICVIFDDGSCFYYELTDNMQQQAIYFDQTVITDIVTIEIVTVYPGTHYQDTAISEISLF